LKVNSWITNLAKVVDDAIARQARQSGATATAAAGGDEDDEELDPYLINHNSEAGLRAKK
jgi:hypothetical protein